TYGDLLRRANQAAQVLVEDFGLVPGNRVLLRGPNNPWLIASWFAVIKAGGVAVTTMALLRAGEITPLADITRPRLAICDHRFAGELAAAGLGIPVILYGNAGSGDLASRSAGRSASFPAVATAADDVALLAPTSGTTGKPKATMHFHRDVLAIQDTFGRHVLRASPDDLFLGTPPVGFTFGLGGLVVFPFSIGACTLLLQPPPPRGTPGTPKATTHSPRGVRATQDPLGRPVLRASRDALFLGTPPVGFTFGLGGLVVFPFSIGACTLLLERASPDELAQAIAD